MKLRLTDWLGKTVEDADMEAVIGKIEDRLSANALAFYIAKSYITDTLGKCEIKHYVNGKETKDKWYYLLNVSPNINQNAFELKSKFINKMIYEGEALMFEEKGNLYVADGFSIEHKPIKGDMFTSITINDEPRTFKRKAEDVFYANFNNGQLKTLIDGMMSDFSEILKYSFDTYKSSNSEKYKLILDEVKAGDKEFNEKFENIIKKQLESFINNRKAVYPQFKGQNLEKISEPSGTTDSTDIRNLRKEIFEIYAEAFKIPVSMLYGNMTNVKDVVSQFITFCISPFAKIIDEEFTRKTTSMEDYLKGSYFKIDLTSIVHHDLFEVWDKLYNVLGSGVYCVDEIRDKIGEEPLNTDFSTTHWISRNFLTIEDALTGEGEIKKNG